MCKWLSLLILFLFMSACAKMAAPEPPLKRIPLPATQVQARQEGAQIFVECVLPSRNIDGSSIQSYRKIEISEGILPQNAASSTLQDDVTLLQVLEGPDLDKRIQQRHFLTKIPDVVKRIAGSDRPYTGMISLSIRFQNERSHWSAPTLSSHIPVGRIAAAPSNLGLSMDKNGIYLKWNPPKQNCDGSEPAIYDGTLIFQRELPNGPVEQIAKITGDETAFTQTNFRFDRRAEYAVGFFRMTAGGMIQSGLSSWEEIDTRDVYSPDTPTGLNVVLEARHIKLIWNPVLDPDIAGYHVFRRSGLEEKLQNLNSKPVTYPSYTDMNADPGKSYYYRVAAVDHHGNRRAMSVEVLYDPKNKKRGD